MKYSSARQVIQAWIEAVNKRDLETIANLYADDSLLLPTFSPHRIRTQEGRLDYFRALASRPGLVVSIHDKTLLIQQAGDSIELASGIYRFQIEIDEEPLVFEARFSYLVDLSAPKPILHHHSSQIPRNLS